MKSRSTIKEKLAEFCLSLGGKVERMRLPDEFGCNVDPSKVIEHFDEFKELYREAKGSGIERIYFGKHDKYFFAYPELGEVGFVLTYEIEPPFPETEEGEKQAVKLLEEVQSEFYEFMSSRGLAPEFKFIPRIESEFEWLDIEARVLADIPEELERLPDIVKAMLEFDKKVREILNTFGRKVETPPKFL
ncbi:MAG: hypothetical protein DRJ40_08400 [Thermoprotei archaeon]|nr:MAG: hypothetical protein DRJ40_08400 [Thermoprotei archaeon]